MKWNGPDSYYSWIVAIACFFINLIFFGLVRLSGVLFVASVTRFGVQRQEASFPYTLATVIRNLIGPLVGYLAFKFGNRYVTIFGIVLAALGVGLCYLAENIQVVTILWGVVYGLGFGFGNGLLPVIINEYFVAHRSTASGFSHSGASIGSFILPPIAEIFLKNYGLSGTYLFLSGFILNCIPAALLFKRANFQIKSCMRRENQSNERQSITSGLKARFYTAENDSRRDKEDNVSGANVRITTKEEIKNNEKCTPHLTFEERMKRLSTQTLLSNYSVRMSCSEPLDFEQIIENSKGSRHVDQTLIESEILSLSSHNSDQDSEKDDVFAGDIRSSSVQYEKTPVSFNQARASSVDYTFYRKENDCSDKQSDDVDEALAFQKNLDLFNNPDNASNFISKIYDKESIPSYSKSDHVNNASISSKIHSENLNNQLKQTEEITSKNEQGINDQTGHIDRQTENTSKNPIQLTKKSLLGSFDVLLDPVFILIAVTHGISTFNHISMMTIIVDFAKDLQIESSKEKYILMLYSVADLFGYLGLGWICDRGYMSLNAFTSVCFACTGLVTIVITWSNGFTSLVIFMMFFGVAQAGIETVFPVAIAQFIDSEKQTIAVPTSTVFIAPFLLAISPLIGYFRDNIGTYIPIFYIFGILSIISCVSWILLPCIARRRRRRTNES